MKKILIFISALIISVFSSIDFRLIGNNDVFRIDLRGAKNWQNIDIVPNGSDFELERPKWCNDCLSIYSKFDKNSSKTISVKFKTLKEDDLVLIKLMGPDVIIDNKRVPVTVNYKNFVVNNKLAFSKLQGLWHDRFYKQPVQMKAGDTVEFSVTAARPFGQWFSKALRVSAYMLFIKFVFLLFVLWMIQRFIDKHPGAKTDALFVSVFVVMIFLPMLKISDATVSKQENRVLAKYPDLIIDNDVNKKFGVQFNNWFNDRFFGRSIFIKIFNTASYHLENIYQNEKALLIKNIDWMFLKKDFSVPKDIGVIVNNIKNFDKFCESNNMKLYILVVPEKEQIYQDILGKYWFFDKKQEKTFNDFMHKIQHVLPDDRIVYPYQELSKAKDQDYVFFKQAHHWTDFGAYTGYNLLATRIKQDFADFNIVSLQEYNKVFSKKIRDDWGRGFNIGHTTTMLNLDNKANELLNTKYTYYYNKQENTVSENRQRYIKLFNNKNQNVKYKLFLTGNSQNENLLQFLPYSVKEIKYLRLNQRQLDDANQCKFMKYYEKELLDFKPDIVVITITADMFVQLMQDFYRN